MSILQRLTLLWRRYSPLEERLLAAVRGVLPPAALPVFDAQVASVNRVQRHPPRWHEIVVYRLRRGRVDWAGVPLFPRGDEFPLADVRFRAAGRSYRASLTAVQGHIFGFGITPGPLEAAFAEWEGQPDVRLTADPMDVDAQSSPEPLPESWQTFLADSRLADLTGWVLYGQSEAYRVALEEGEFLVLAEREGDSFLLHRLDPGPPGFFIQHSHDRSPEPLRGDLHRALRERSP